MGKLKVKKSAHPLKLRELGFLNYYFSGFCWWHWFVLLIDKGIDGVNKVRRKEVLGVCVTGAQRCFYINLLSVLNYVHALVILFSTFHSSRNVSAIVHVNVFRFLFDTSQLVRLKSMRDNSFLVSYRNYLDVLIFRVFFSDFWFFFFFCWILAS